MAAKPAPTKEQHETELQNLTAKRARLEEETAGLKATLEELRKIKSPNEDQKTHAQNTEGRIGRYAEHIAEIGKRITELQKLLKPAA